MSDVFVSDLSFAAEAWFKYADRRFGKSILIPSKTHPGKQAWVREKCQEEGVNSESAIAHGVFIDGYLHALGWEQDEKGSWDTRSRLTENQIYAGC